MLKYSFLLIVLFARSINAVSLVPAEKLAAFAKALAEKTSLLQQQHVTDGEHRLALLGDPMLKDGELVLKEGINLPDKDTLEKEYLDAFTEFSSGWQITDPKTVYVDTLLINPKQYTLYTKPKTAEQAKEGNGMLNLVSILSSCGVHSHITISSKYSEHRIWLKK